VRVRDGKTLYGRPFAETKEQLGGFYLIETADLDNAWAQVPVGAVGSIEVRPRNGLDE
jgi:hypothetical protein